MNRYLIFSVLVLNLILTTEVSALTISPVKVEVTGEPGQTLTGTLDLLNEQTEARTYFSSFENFEPAGDTGAPRFIGSSDGLATWLSTDSSVQLKNNEEKNITYRITIPAETEPGGYFAAIFWGESDPSTEKAGEVAIGGKLGLIILLRVAGDIVESAGVTNFGTEPKQTFFTALPITFNYKFSNNGGDREVPQGEILIKNIFGQTTATLLANPNEGSVLPGSSRKFSVTWGSTDLLGTNLNFLATAKKQLADLHFGLYSANLNIVWGTKNTEVAAQSYFFILPWQLMVLVVIGVLILYYALRRYNKMIIARANKS